MVGGSGPAFSDLSKFQLSRIISGQSLVINGVLFPSSSPELEALRQALRGKAA